MCLDYSDTGAFKYLADRERYDAELRKAMLRAVSSVSGAYFLDVGSSYGAYSLAIADVGRYGLVKRIYAFEPDGRCVTALRRSIEANQFTDLLVAVPCVVGDFEGTAQLHLSERASTSNRSYAAQGKDIKLGAATTVESKTLDGFVASECIPFENFFAIKVDVEGNELRVLRGATQLLRQSRGYYLQMEFFPDAIADAGFTCSDVIDELAALEFEGCAVFDDGRFTALASSTELRENLRAFSTGAKAGDSVDLVLWKNCPAGPQ